MKLYVITDEIKEDVVNVFMAKSDKSASKQLELELSKCGKEVEMKIYALDIYIDYQDDFVALFDNCNDAKPRLIYSFPKDYVENKEKLRKDILEDSYEEEN